VELQHQLRVCFRFGLCATADPQTWWDAFRYVIASLLISLIASLISLIASLIRWDAFRYAVSLGHPNGLSELLPAGAAVALPVADGRVVSSRDVTRLHVALPCMLGVRRKHSGGTKHTLVLPPSVASSWAARVHWELAMVLAFGVTFPRADAERSTVGATLEALAAELLTHVGEARAARDGATLEALATLLRLYEGRMGQLVPLLRSTLQDSALPYVALLDAPDVEGRRLERPRRRRALSRVCSPRYCALLGLMVP
jgi:hypothetical protein